MYQLLKYYIKKGDCHEKYLCDTNNTLNGGIT